MVEHRYFFALLPPLREARRIGLIRDRLADVRTPVETLRLHLTLAITGDYPEAGAATQSRLIEIGSSVSAAPFALRLDRLSAGGTTYALRPSQRPARLRALQAPLQERLARSALLRARWSFNPHVTLGYHAGRPSFEDAVEPIEWRAEELVLIHSMVGAHRHEMLGRWPLIERQASLF
jgi:RNA 2',3'-cyclic 3'-phosphodiesterase